MSLAQGTTTRGEIISQALQRAGNASRDLTAQARIRLNRLLADLYLGWDWPFLFVSSDLTLGSATFPLPSDFAKPVDPWALRVVRDGNGAACSIRVRQVEPMAFVAHASPPDQQGSFPLIWSIDFASFVGQIWPLPSTPLPATLRYKREPPAVDPSDTATYDADVPIFPWANYLSDEVLAWAMSYESDPRAYQQKADNEAMFSRIRAATFPPATAAFTTGMGLDPDIFGRPWNGNDGGWPSR